MNPFAPCLYLALTITAAQQPATQTAVRPVAPTIPTGAAPADRAALNQAANLVSKGLFDLATTQLGAVSPAPLSHVWVDWTPVPRPLREGYREAIKLAMHDWNAVLAPGFRFDFSTREDESDVTVLFDRAVVEMKFNQPRLLCSSTQLQTIGARRTGIMRMALDVPGTEGAHLTASITHLASQGFGAFLGLAPSLDSASVMGPDTHATSIAVSPSLAEQRIARQLMDARMQLADFAKRRVSLRVPHAKALFVATQLDAGDVWRGEDARYVFRIRNSGDSPLEIDAKPTCGCTVANFDKVIAPGAEGKIEASIHTTNFKGKLEKTIEFSSNDADLPAKNLVMTANVRSAIEVSPSETPLIGLKTAGATTQELEIRIGGKDPIHVTRAACSAPYASAKVDPIPSATGSAYKVTLTIDPAAPMGRSAFLVTAFTDSAHEPQVNITAVCEKGIVVMPASAYLGTLGPQTALPVNQSLTISRRDGKVGIQKIEGGSPELEVKPVASEDGKQVRLQLTYRGGWPAGLIQRKIVVHTDDPAQPTIEIPVMANVVAPAQPAAGK
jgi:ribosomal protein S18 acetylase RimI-like enzyme